jgi:hypothetical protein
MFLMARSKLKALLPEKMASYIPQNIFTYKYESTEKILILRFITSDGMFSAAFSKLKAVLPAYQSSYITS